MKRKKKSQLKMENYNYNLQFGHILKKQYQSSVAGEESYAYVCFLFQSSNNDL